MMESGDLECIDMMEDVVKNTLVWIHAGSELRTENTA
jgi:hypothetical protein